MINLGPRLNPDLLYFSQRNARNLADTSDLLEKQQPRPQGLLLDDVQNGGSSGEDPGKG